MTIDLRSDTVTKPSKEMLDAMMQADVGDDVYGEDPTVEKLQNKIASLLGKEAALFVPTGVMSNQLALKSHCTEGDEVILEYDAHIFNYESGAAAFLSRVQLHPLKGENGILNAEQIQAAIRTSDYWNPITTLVCLENTHNRAGGTVYPMAAIQKIREMTRTKNLKLHLDGARLWNAAVATGISLREYGEQFDSVSICLSKGMGCPVGSVLTGTKDFITKAHRFRKLFGGGMRQIGILAAAGLYAIDHNFSKLAADHAKAGRLGKAFSNNPAFEIDLATVQTNIVIANTKKLAVEIVEAFKAQGLLIVPFGERKIRAVTHLDATDEQIDAACKIITAFK
jgi:threonine aldolase